MTTTTAQLPIFKDMPGSEPEPTLDERFTEYHQCNPYIYEALRDLALRQVENGKKRLSIKQMFELLRCNPSLARPNGEEWKLNNNYHSRYARMLMDRNRALQGLFELRNLETEE